jgi:hypothetical protein
MSIARVAGADRGAGFVATIRSVLPDLLFVLIAVYNAIRLFRHAMWRDELQAFMVAAASNTPLDLFAKLKYEGHPGLWHLLLWVVTRFTTDPVAMQVLHLVIALGVWVLVWRLSPFRPVGKAASPPQLLPVLGIFRGQPGLRARRAARLRLCGAASSPP